PRRSSSTRTSGAWRKPPRTHDGSTRPRLGGVVAFRADVQCPSSDIGKSRTQQGGDLVAFFLGQVSIGHGQLRLVVERPSLRHLARFGSRKLHFRVESAPDNPMETAMRIMTFNANGVRSAANKGFFPWFAAQDVDILCMQETKAQEHQLADVAFRPAGYRVAFRDAITKKG